MSSYDASVVVVDAVDAVVVFFQNFVSVIVLVLHDDE